MLTVGVDARALRPVRTGIGTTLSYLLQELGKRATLYLYSPSYIPPRPPTLPGIWQIGPKLPGSLWYHLALGKQLAYQRCEVLLAPLNVLPLYCPVPAVVILHDLTPFTHPVWHTLKQRWTVIPFLAHTVEKATFIVVPSHETQKDVLRYFPHSHNKIRVIPPGFPQPLPREKATSLRGLPPLYCLTISTLEPRKNLSFLIQLWEKHPELPPLVIAGAKGWKVTLPQSQKVKILANLTEKEKWGLLYGATLFIFASLKEGFGYPLWEALAARVPVVSTPVPSAIEFPHPSVLVVPPEENAFLEGIIQGLKTLPKPRDLSLFPSWQTIASRYLYLLKKVTDDVP